MQRIGYVGALSKDNLSVYQPKTEVDRLNGYRDAMKAAGLPETVLYLPRNFHNQDYGALLKRLQAANLDGCIACWGTYGVQLLTALRAIGKRVPEDVKVIALDSLPYLDQIDPPLTAMSLPFFEMAQAGTKALLAMLRKPETPAVREFFHSRLEIRNSV